MTITKRCHYCQTKQLTRILKDMSARSNFHSHTHLQYTRENPECTYGAEPLL